MKPKSLNKLKIIVICQNVSEILELLINKKEINFIGIIEDGPKNKINKLNLLIWRIANNILYILFKKNFSLSIYAKYNNLKYFYNTDGKELELEEWLRIHSPDLVIIYSMSRIIKKECFNNENISFINIHTSLLPQFRGANPDFWIAYHGISEGGVTIHKVEEKVDTGDILAQEKFEIARGMKQVDYQLKIRQLVVKLIDNVINNYLSGNLEAKKQAKNSNLKAPRLKSNDIFDYLNEELTINRIIHLFGLQNKLLNRNHRLRVGERFNYVVINEEKNSFDEFITACGRKIKINALDGIIELKPYWSLKNFIYDIVYYLIVPK